MVSYIPPTRDIFFLCHGFTAGKQRVPIPANLEVLTFVKPGQIMVYPLQGYLFDLLSQQHTELLAKSLKPLDKHSFLVDIGEDPKVPQVETVYVSVGHEGDEFRNLPCNFSGPELWYLGFYNPESARTVISDFLPPNYWLSEGQLGELTEEFVINYLGGELHQQFTLLDVCTFLKSKFPDEKIRLYFFSCQEAKTTNVPNSPVAEEKEELTLRKAMNQLKGGKRTRRKHSTRRH